MTESPSGKTITNVGFVLTRCRRESYMKSDLTGLALLVGDLSTTLKVQP